MEKNNAVTGCEVPKPANQGLGEKNKDPTVPAGPLNNESPPARPTQYSDFPFFTDAMTNEHIAQGRTKLMILLRGAPGSGKTVISQELQNIYGASIRVQAISGNCFRALNGAEHRIPGRLSESHGWCQKECDTACKADGVQLVMIDSTNIEHWEFREYLGMARRYGFIVLFVEPRTPWRHDARLLHSPQYNVNEVELGRIEARLKKLKERLIVPMFYGWFFSAADSLELQRLAFSLAKQMAHADAVKHYTEINRNCLLVRLVDTPESDATTWKEGKELLYAAACHTLDGDKVYSAKKEVKKALGRVYELEIIGLLVTKETASFHVKLTKDQIKLWDHVDTTHPRLPANCAHIAVQIADGVGDFVAGVDLRKFLGDKGARPMADLDSAVLKNSAKDSWYMELMQPVHMRAMFVSSVDPDPETRSRRRLRNRDKKASSPVVDENVSKGQIEARQLAQNAHDISCFVRARRIFSTMFFFSTVFF